MSQLYAFAVEAVVTYTPAATGDPPAELDVHAATARNLDIPSHAVDELLESMSSVYALGASAESSAVRTANLVAPRIVSLDVARR